MSNETDLVHYLWLWMEISTTRSMCDWGRFVKTTELSMPQFGLLMHLYYRGGCGISDIGKHSGVTNAAVSQLIERMVEKQLIERSEDPTDRRAKQIVLAEKGRALVETSINERYRWVEELVASLTVEEQQAVLKALPVMIETFQRLYTSGES